MTQEERIAALEKRMLDLEEQVEFLEFDYYDTADFDDDEDWDEEDDDDV